MKLVRHQRLFVLLQEGLSDEDVVKQSHLVWDFMITVIGEKYTIGYLNSTISNQILKFVYPTLSTNVGDITVQPLNESIADKENVIDIVKGCISISNDDWNSFESVYDKLVLANQNMSDYTQAELSYFSVGELQRPFCYLMETQNKPLSVLQDKATEIRQYEEKIHHLDDGVKKLCNIPRCFGKNKVGGDLICILRS